MHGVGGTTFGAFISFFGDLVVHFMYSRCCGAGREEEREFWGCLAKFQQKEEKCQVIAYVNGACASRLCAKTSALLSRSRCHRIVRSGCFCTKSTLHLFISVPCCS